MRILKKIVVTIVCLSLLGLMVFGCDTSSGDVKDIVEYVESVENVVAEEVEENKEPDNQEVVMEETVEETSVSIEEQILVDQDGIKITATEYAEDEFMGDAIKLLIENNSDITVGVGCDAVIVNNYMITDFFATEVAAGKKANEMMYLSSSELEAAGIESVGQVEMYLRVYDSSTYDNIFKTDCITIQTSEFANMDVVPNDSGMELYNDNGIKIVGKTVDEDSFWGTAILLYCENASDKNVSISVEEMSINGFMMNPLFSTTVYAGKMSIQDITIFSSDLEENGIETIEDVELKFHIYDDETYSTIADSDAITFSAQ